MIIVARFTFQVFGINTYVLYDTDSHEAAIVDPGMFDDEERSALDNFITREGLKVVHLINTHAHIDHMLGNAYVENKYGVKAAGNPADDFLAERLAQQAREFGLPASGLDNFGGFVPLRDGDTVSLGKSEIKILEVPGHSPGHIALYDAADGFVAGGDILFQGSIGRADLPGGDMRQLIDGIRAKLLTLPPETRVYPGHGPETTIGMELRHNPYLTGSLDY